MQLAHLGCGVAQKGTAELSRVRRISSGGVVAQYGVAKLIRELSRVLRSSLECGLAHLGWGVAQLVVRRLSVNKPEFNSRLGTPGKVSHEMEMAFGK